MTIWQQIEAIQRLSSEDESALGTRIKAGDDAALQKLVAANLWIAVPIARAMCRGKETRGKWEPEDLLGEGTAALMSTAKTWDAAGRTRFADYARMRVRGAMKDFLRRKADAVRGSGQQAISLDAQDGSAFHECDKSASMLDRLIAPESEEVSDFSDFLHGLSETQAEIVRLRILAPIPESVEAVATRLKCTPSYVRRTVAKFMATLSAA